MQDSPAQQTGCLAPNALVLAVGLGAHCCDLPGIKPISVAQWDRLEIMGRVTMEHGTCNNVTCYNGTQGWWGILSEGNAYPNMRQSQPCVTHALMPVC
jgi:hypothetical protein